jgi:hypothetical protein
MDAMNENDFIPTFTHATERDVDLLLVEELYSSIDFVHLMAMNAGLTKPIWQWDVKHSKRRTRSRREIDIFIDILNLDQTRSALLIENKIDASEQPDQAESYREELAVLAPDYHATAMIIVCPEGYRDKYVDFIEKFDACLTYQSIRNWFIQVEAEAGNEAVLRFRLRAELFDQAIHKHRRGYTAIPDSVVGDFNAKYVKMLAELAPQISPGNSMLKPANPRESTSMIFDQRKTLSGLQEDIRPSRFSHELGRGSDRRANYVAVTFAGWGAALPAIREVLEADTAGLDVEFTSKKPNKSRPNPGLVMSLPTAPVDNQKSFSGQQDLLADGIEQAMFLRNWLLENRQVLVGWRSEVDKFLRSF